MLSFNNIYGQPAALMRRRIWSGEERKVPSVSMLTANAFRPLGATSPPNIVPDHGVNNGRVNFLVVGDKVYTSADLRTMVLRFTHTGSGRWPAIYSIAERGGNVVIACGSGVPSSSATQYESYVSVNDGLTFTSSPLGAVRRVMCAGGFFYGFPEFRGLSRCETGTSASVSLVMPVDTSWQSVVYNGERYLTISSDGTVLATSVDGLNFSVSTTFAAFKLSADIQPQNAFAVGRRFVLVEVRGNTVRSIVTEDGASFSVQSWQVFDGENGERCLGVPQYAVMADGCAYLKMYTVDWAQIRRVRLIVSADGITWRAFPPLAGSNVSGDSTSAGKAMFGLGPGKGLYVAQGLDSVVHVSETLNDRDFYYELGAA
ncbi:hypothetical protein [Delftia sp. HK171]|uniref:hypothetical protein n=1 Tax=Delftia sp. HK171 TaxID=1920191 RepID=UPI000AF9F3C8|nr:hypothetical protein [Delftia sp. HK171]